MDTNLLHAICCAFMTGVLWVIQLVHYPAFAAIDKNNFHRFHWQHTQRITWVVGPVMLIELLTGISLFLLNQSPLWSLNLILLLMTWGLTFFLSVPLHNKLMQHQDSGVIHRLVQTNWPRTVLWTARLTLVISDIVSRT